MTLISLALFFLILFFLVIVHEGGHFLFAKLTKMRVDEFAFGFPPRLAAWKKGETKYILNLLPLGGYVKIFGEQALSKEELELDKNKMDIGRSFERQSVFSRLLVLSGGVVANVLACVLLLAISLMVGGNVAISTDEAKLTPFEERSVVIADVHPESNLYRQGLRVGDKVQTVKVAGAKDLATSTLYAEALTAVTSANQNNLINIEVKNGDGANKVYSVIPQAGLVDGKKVLGIALADTTYKKMSLSEAVPRAFKDTYLYTKYIFRELGKLLAGIFSHNTDVKQALSGPIGMAAATKQIAEKDLSNILGFAALISLSLAVFNILPFPALDGGRIFFVLLELPMKYFFKKSVSRKVEQTVHALGFIALIVLMVVVSYFDILKLL